MATFESVERWEVDVIIELSAEISGTVVDWLGSTCAKAEEAIGTTEAMVDEEVIDELGCVDSANDAV